MPEEPKFNKIPGLTDRRRVTRLGHIRLGVRARNAKGITSRCKHPDTELCPYCSHPTETDHFVVPPEVAKIYGDNPTELEVMFLKEANEENFPVAFKMYGQSRGLKCIGNGTTAKRLVDEKERRWEYVDCPCDQRDKACKAIGALYIMLPKVNVGGVYQISTSSFHSIVDVQSGMDYVRMLYGKLALIPVILIRKPTETYEGAKRTHYTLDLRSPSRSIRELNQMRIESSRIYEHGETLLLPAPVEHVGDRQAVAAEVLDGFVDEENGETIRAEFSDVTSNLKAEVAAHREKAAGKEIAAKLDDEAAEVLAEPGEQKPLVAEPPGKIEAERREQLIGLVNEALSDGKLNMGSLKALIIEATDGGETELAKMSVPALRAVALKIAELK